MRVSLGDTDGGVAHSEFTEKHISHIGHPHEFRPTWSNYHRTSVESIAYVRALR